MLVSRVLTVIGAAILVVLLVPWFRDGTAGLFMPPPALRGKHVKELLEHFVGLMLAYLLMSLALALGFTASGVTIQELLSVGDSGSPSILASLPGPLFVAFVASVVARATAITSSQSIGDGLWDTVAVAVVPVFMAASAAGVKWLPDQAALMHASDSVTRQPELVRYLSSGVLLCILVECALWYIGARGVQWSVPASVVRSMLMQKETVDEVVLGPEAVRDMYVGLLDDHTGHLSHVLWLTRSASDEVAAGVEMACAANPGVHIQLLADPTVLEAAKDHGRRWRDAGASVELRRTRAGQAHYLLAITSDGLIEMGCAYGRSDGAWDGPEWGFRTRSHLLCRECLSHFECLRGKSEEVPVPA